MICPSIHEWPIFHYITWFVPSPRSLFHVCSTTMFHIVPWTINLELKDKYWNWGRGRFPGFGPRISPHEYIERKNKNKSVQISMLIYRRPPSKRQKSQAINQVSINIKTRSFYPILQHFDSEIGKGDQVTRFGLCVHSKCYCYMSNMMSDRRVSAGGERQS